MIPTLGQFGILKRLAAVPLDPLVDALRDLHQRGVSDSPQLQALLAPPKAMPSPTPDRTTIENGPRPALGDYEAARKHFIEHADRLRKQAILAERLLERLGQRSNAATSEPRHRVLTVECVRRGTSSTQFVVANTLEHAVTVAFRVGRVHGGLETIDRAEVISFDPPAPRLQPGGEAMVRMSIDLRRDDGLANAIELGVDLLGDERLLAKLWVCIRIQS